jgi:hypothetical protein
MQRDINLIRDFESGDNAKENYDMVLKKRVVGKILESDPDILELLDIQDERPLNKFKDANKYVKGAKDADRSNFLDDNGVFSVQAKYNFGKAALDAIFVKSDVDTDKGFFEKGASKKGIVVTASYGGAEAAKVGSWGLVGKYYNQGAGTFVAHTMNGGAQNFLTEGFKGYSLAGYVTVAKNMVAGLEWYDLKGKETDNKEKTLWSELVVSF